MLPLLLALQLGAAPAPVDRDPGWLHAAIAASMVAHAADIATTMYCRGAGVCSEVNPLLRPLQDKPIAFASAKMAVAVGMNYALLKLHKSHPKLTLVLALSQVVVYSTVAIHNAKTIP